MKEDLKKSRFFPVLERVAKAYNIPAEIQVIADKFGISRQSIYGFLKDGFPHNRLEEVSEITKTPLPWLEYGVSAQNEKTGPVNASKKNMDVQLINEIKNEKEIDLLIYQMFVRKEGKEKVFEEFYKEKRWELLQKGTIN